VGLNNVMITKCHQFYLSCSIPTINHMCSVTNTKCKPSIVCHSLYKNVFINLHLFFNPNFNHLWQYFIIELLGCIILYQNKSKLGMTILVNLRIRSVIWKVVTMTLNILLSILLIHYEKQNLNGILSLWQMWFKCFLSK
jgi:hypothetical protein